MAPPRSYRLVLDLSGQELPDRHDGGEPIAQEPTFDGHVLLQVNGSTEYECRLSSATPAEIGETFDEMEKAADRLNLKGLDLGDEV